MINQSVLFELIRQSEPCNYLHSILYFQNEFVADVLEIGDGRELESGYYTLKIGRTLDKQHYFVAIYDKVGNFVSVFHPDNYYKVKNIIVRRNNNFLAVGKLVDSYFIKNLDGLYANFFNKVKQYSNQDFDIELKISFKYKIQ